VVWWHLEEAADVVREHPGLRTILNHTGYPLDRSPEALAVWRRGMEALAACPNVSCKISGLVAYADPAQWKEDDLRPYVEHVIACFGWERVLFGSDWPVCTLSASYDRWVEALHSLTRNAGAAHQRKLFYDNAVRVYRLE